MLVPRGCRSTDAFRGNIPRSHHRRFFPKIGAEREKQALTPPPQRNAQGIAPSLKGRTSGSCFPTLSQTGLTRFCTQGRPLRLPAHTAPNIKATTPPTTDPTKRIGTRKGKLTTPACMESRWDISRDSRRTAAGRRCFSGYHVYGTTRAVYGGKELTVRSFYIFVGTALYSTYTGLSFKNGFVIGAKRNLSFFPLLHLNAF